MTFYNQIRPHRARDGRTPDRVYWEEPACTAHCRLGINGQASLMNGKMLSKQAERPQSSSQTGNLDRRGAELVGVDQEVLPIGYADLVENVRHVMPDRTVANRQFVGDIFV